MEKMHMTEHEVHELLVRVDERTAVIFKSLKDVDRRMKSIEDTQKIRPCAVQADKIKKLEKATYGTMFGSAIFIFLFIFQWIWRKMLGG